MKENRSNENLLKSSVKRSSGLFLYSAWLIFAMLLSFTGNAQMQRSISGTVTETTTGEPIPGAAVIIKGTTQGASTDLNGQFTLNVNDEDILVVSFVGFATQEVPVAGQTSLSIKMEEEVAFFDEVVVVGYGVQKKKLVTGATIQVDGENLQKRNTISALQALQGQTSGVQITSTSGQPGEGIKVVVRGVGTIGDANPLYIVDGVQTGDISYLNSADIESIDVLKDAASAAIYGSQAANGVVLVTTKSGKKGNMKISFDAYYGVQNVERRVNMLNGKEYAVIMNEAAINSGKAPYFTADQITTMDEGTDWIDKMFYDNAVTQNYTLGLTGGNDASVYSVSLSYTGQEGIVGGPKVSNYERYNFRVNSEHQLYDGFLKFGENLTFSYVKNIGINVGNQYYNSLRSAFATSPFLPMYDDNGDYLNNKEGVLYDNGKVWSPWSPGENNPYADMIYNNQRDNNDQTLLGNIYAEVNPMKNLRFKSTFGIDFFAQEQRSFEPEYELSIYAFRLFDYASQSMNRSLSMTWDNVLTYDFKLNDHSFTAMAGNSVFQDKGSTLYFRNSDLTISDLDHAYIDNAKNTDVARMTFRGSPNDEVMLLSYFGRLNYNFKETYLLNATFRADGSSRFAKSSRWGYFPSVSAGWVVSNESFMEPSQSLVDYLKLRVSWGQVGNQNIAPWQYLAPVHVGSAVLDPQNPGIVRFRDGNYYFGTADFDAAGNTIGAYPSRLSNEDLKWETSEQTNIGLDARLLNARLNLTLDWYQKLTKDWLLEAPILATAGALPPYVNGGDVKNTGIELSLNWSDKIGKVNYYISGNISKNKNEVTEVPTSDGIVHGLSNQLYDNSLEFYHRAETGYPIGYFWGWQTNGIFQNEAEVSSYRSSAGTIIQPNAQPGDLKYVDQDGNGVINEEDKTMVGDPNPDYVFGFSLGFDYEGWDFSLAANGVAGNQIVQSYRNHSNALTNYTTEILNRWHGEGTSNTVPRVTETNINYLFSDIFVKDGDFLRISNISLGYDFAKKLINYKNLGQLRLYASVQNAFTFTKYNGMDPEIGYGVEDGSAGVDLGYYPRPRTILIGVNVKF